MNIRENIPLKHLTTFKTGGNARFFTCIRKIEEIADALRFAQEKFIPIFILGGGSNILISDAGFSGLVMKMEISGIEEQDEEIIAGAGESWDGLVEYAVSKNLHGIENLSYIPGTVGAAPVQNIGAYGTEVKSVIAWVEAIDLKTSVLRKFSNEECGFSYRDSFFKKPEGKNYIITRVAFSLKKKAALKTSYKDIKEYLAKNNLSESELTVKKLREIVIDIRKNKLPDIFSPDEVGTAGSFFKNPIIEKSAYEKLLKLYPELPFFPVEADQSFAKNSSKDNVKIPAAWLLDKLCGFKGYREENIGVYKNQALVLVNFGDASAHKILSLAEKMIACVKEKTDIILEKEVQII